MQARYVARDVEYYGQTVPAGSIILLLNGSANRDERHFADADRFDIRHAPRPHLSFGHGLHFCLGAALARMEARVALAEVLKRWPDWQVDYDNAVRAHGQRARMDALAGHHRLSRCVPGVGGRPVERSHVHNVEGAGLDDHACCRSLSCMVSQVIAADGGAVIR